MLDEMPNNLFTDSSKTTCDPSCGNGQFLAEVLLRRLENGIELSEALSTIYGVDIMEDNVKVCQDRFLCGVERYRHIVEKNIVCADALTYDFSFQ
jgi:type I restriction-modification system DNA methylase subunit